MATLRSIKAHAVAVSNIQKITNTIKMVATSKFVAAERSLRYARVFGQGTQRFYEVSKLTYEPSEGVVAVVTSDRGLCGGTHSRICRKVRVDHTKNPYKGGIVCLGEKSKGLLAYDFKKSIRMVVNGLGHKVPTFGQASAISGMMFGDSPHGVVTFPYFNNILSYKVMNTPVMTADYVDKSTVPHRYELEPEDLEDYMKFSSASIIFYTMNETFVTELANRITAMSSASMNASKFKKQLMLEYNRKRQAVITTELCDIISGVNTTEKKKKKDRVLKFPGDESGGEPSPVEASAVEAPVGETSVVKEDETPPEPCF